MNRSSRLNLKRSSRKSVIWSAASPPLTGSRCALVDRVEPGLILADIQLADGSSGIDAAYEILQRIYSPLIFITAYPERLLTGDRVEPTFIITKPFKPEMVKAMVSQALFFDLRASTKREAAA